ncbi:MAG: aldolase/citrate lyase family protein [Casimicrobiaceae bacterium]
MTRPFRDLAEASVGFGTWSQVADPDLIDMLGLAGFEFTIIDTEHGMLGIESVQGLVRACDANGIVPLVRVPDNDRGWIGRCLDAGAAAVIVPGIDSLDGARRALAAARFAPHGNRGACPGVRAGAAYAGNWRGYTTQQHDEAGVILLIETPQAVAEIDAIVALRGLRAVLIGPFDLSVTMGHQGDFLHAEVTAAIERVVAAARAHDMPVILPVFSPEPAEGKRQVDAWCERGVRLFTVGTDKILIAAQFKRYREGLR